MRIQDISAYRRQLQAEFILNRDREALSPVGAPDHEKQIDLYHETH